MEGTEFQKYFNHFPYLLNYYRGTFAIDTLPKTLKTDQFLIFNNETSDKKGQHWLCLYKEKKIYYVLILLVLMVVKEYYLKSIVN